MPKYSIENWLTDSDIKMIEYSDYWNDEEKEKIKEWYIVDGNFSKMEDYLLKTGLPQDLNRCVDILKTEFNYELKGTGIDLGAGNLWAAPHLLSLGEIDKLYCLEYSKHRLLKLGPKVLEHYNVPKEKVVLVVGSFYDLHIEDNCLDFVFLSSAFHHADRPDDLLAEIQRVLKPNGIVIIIGEHIVDTKRTYLRYLVKFLISTCVPHKVQQELFGKTFHVKRQIPKSSDLFPTDPVLGDHYYIDKEYRLMFSKYAFKIKHIKSRGSQFQSFVLMDNSVCKKIFPQKRR